MIFSEQKVAQMAAYFLKRRGGQMSYLKLMKLLYLADRESLDRFNSTMSDDTHVSMPHGPVLSTTLNLITGQIESPIWRNWVCPDARHEVSLAHPFENLDDLDELSEADIEVLEHVWVTFGHMNRWAIRDYTHAHIPEWVDPGRSSAAIDLRTTFVALGRNEEQAESAALDIFERKTLGRAIAELI